MTDWKRKFLLYKSTTKTWIVIHSQQSRDGALFLDQQIGGIEQSFRVLEIRTVYRNWDTNFSFKSVFACLLTCLLTYLVTAYYLRQ